MCRRGSAHERTGGIGPSKRLAPTPAYPLPPSTRQTHNPHEKKAVLTSYPPTHAAPACTVSPSAATGPRRRHTCRARVRQTEWPLDWAMNGARRVKKTHFATVLQNASLDCIAPLLTTSYIALHSHSVPLPEALKWSRVIGKITSARMGFEHTSTSGCTRRHQAQSGAANHQEKRGEGHRVETGAPPSNPPNINRQYDMCIPASFQVNGTSWCIARKDMAPLRCRGCRLLSRLLCPWRRCCQPEHPQD